MLCPAELSRECLSPPSEIFPFNPLGEGEVKRDFNAHIISLSQKSYSSNLVEGFGLQDAHTVTTPTYSWGNSYEGPMSQDPRGRSWRTWPVTTTANSSVLYSISHSLHFLTSPSLSASLRGSSRIPAAYTSQPPYASCKGTKAPTLNLRAQSSEMWRIFGFGLGRRP